MTEPKPEAVASDATESGASAAALDTAALDTAALDTAALDAAALDASALGRWMDTAGLPGGGAPTMERLPGGSQNELFIVERDGLRAVLRTPPASAPATRHDGLRRELRLLRALKGADVPHAELVAGTDDATVLGAPFYLMQPVDGWSPAGSGKWPDPYESAPSVRAPLAFELVRGAALLSRVDWQERGLTGFGRPENFHERQVDRWLAFLAEYKFRDLPGLDEASGWLRTHRPHHWSPGIMHGDYQFANVMFSHDVPARLAAIIDWEMTTIGDPLLDLGWVLMAWPPEGDDMVHAQYLSLGGMPSRADLLTHYETISGRSTEDIDYYVVLARWKLGIVLEMSYAKFAAGQAVDPKAEVFGPLVLELIRKAAELSRSAKVKAV
jgi:aminoglycoside phosphotransferase (APT) family kinase protein